jgi:hypothetical protein
MEYAEFVASKLRNVPPVAEKRAETPDWPLFPWQKALVDLALQRGRAAIFADTGTGKTRMELAWAHAVSIATGRPVLLLAPLAVGKQTVREAEKIGAHAVYRSTADEIAAADRIIVTNYERLHHFDAIRRVLGGIVLDESSILKALDGKTRKALTDLRGRDPLPAVRHGDTGTERLHRTRPARRIPRRPDVEGDARPVLHAGRQLDAELAAEGPRRTAVLALGGIVGHGDAQAVRYRLSRWRRAVRSAAAERAPSGG